MVPLSVRNDCSENIPHVASYAIHVHAVTNTSYNLRPSFVPRWNAFDSLSHAHLASEAQCLHHATQVGRGSALESVLCPSFIARLFEQAHVGLAWLDPPSMTFWLQVIVEQQWRQVFRINAL